MKIFLCSLYYESKRVTGANKRFDYFGKYLARNEEVSLTVIVRDGEIPSWATDAIVLPKYQYLPPLFRRILYWLHLSKIFFKCDNIIISDFMPIPFIPFKGNDNYYQLVHDIRNFTDYNRAFFKKMASVFQGYQWRKTQNILTVSNFTKWQLIRYCNVNENKIKVSYNGIELIERNKLVRDIDFLYIATFEKRKNHDNLIKAFYYYVNEINTNAKLYLIGRDLGYKKSILELVSSLQLSQSVIFIDSVSENELSRIYERTHCFISPSLYEGFGMPIIEAMYHGCNVACSNIDVFREIAQNHASYFEPDNIHSIIDAMCLAREYENNNPETLHYVNVNFSWDSITAKFLEDVRY